VPFRTRFLLAAIALLGAAQPAVAGTFTNFESQQVHSLALTPDGTKLLAVNTPDARLSVFAINGPQPVLLFEVAVGVEPVSVAAESNGRAWVVNHISDSVSLVDLATGNVVETLAVGDEPTDVVFANGKAFVCVSQEDAVKIFDPAHTGIPPVVVPIFGSDPQALGRSADGQKVFVGVFESGNRTSIANTQDVVAHGGLPAPNPAGRPNTALILRSVNGHWVDELNRNYDATHPYTLPDHDVAVLNTASPNPVPQYIDGLGTLIYNLGVHPVTGKLWVTNTDAQNHIRFEPNLRGKFVRTRVAIVDPALPGTVTNVDLNSHINYNITPGPQSEIDQSLSQPGAIVFRSTGGAAYVTALGSALVAELDDAANVVARIPAGEGPSGLALDEARHRLYVLDRFTNTLGVRRHRYAQRRAHPAGRLRPEPGGHPQRPQVSLRRAAQLRTRRRGVRFVPCRRQHGQHRLGSGRSQRDDAAAAARSARSAAHRFPSDEGPDGDANAARPHRHRTVALAR
jgi:YVTN family beta-propeller protein